MDFYKENVDCNDYYINTTDSTSGFDISSNHNLNKTESLIENSVTSENNNKCSSSPFYEKIDRLTAIEMLQLLKEYKRREFLYASRISMLQKELFMCYNQSPDFKEKFNISSDRFYDISSNGQLALLDPSINLEIRELRLKLFEQSGELQRVKDELKASTFSADSVMGRRLINKCKTLQEENSDIGKMVLEIHLQPLLIQIHILTKHISFYKEQMKCLHEINSDLDEENERLCQQLQEMTLHYKKLESENKIYKNELTEQKEAVEMLKKSYDNVCMGEKKDETSSRASRNISSARNCTEQSKSQKHLDENYVSDRRVNSSISRHSRDHHKRNVEADGKNISSCSDDLISDKKSSIASKDSKKNNPNKSYEYLREDKHRKNKHGISVDSSSDIYTRYSERNRSGSNRRFRSDSSR